jgi:uncharacterized membrane protein HdeD (DUF308 family)
MKLLDIVEGDSWRASAVRGASAVVFGVLALAWPGPTVWVFVVLFGVYALVDGFAELGVFVARTPDNPRRNGVVLFRAFVSMTVAVIAFAWPGITALALLYLIAAWAFVVGGAEIALAIRHRAGEAHDWLIGLGGVLSIALAVVLVADPGSGVLTITWAVAWFAIVGGIISLVRAWQLRNAHPHAGASHATPRPGALA